VNEGASSATVDQTEQQHWITIEQIRLPEFCQPCIAISIVAIVQWNQVAS
jgi:hypothetical protein